MSNFEDIMQDNWFYQYILEKGRQQGLELAREKLRQGVMNVVRARFPDMADLAQQRANVAHDFGILGRLIMKMALASTAEEARRSLLEVTDGSV